MKTKINTHDVRIKIALPEAGWALNLRGVELQHIPSGIRVTSIDGRSFYANREKALEKLAAALEKEAKT